MSHHSTHPRGETIRRGCAVRQEASPSTAVLPVRVRAAGVLVLFASAAAMLAGISAAPPRSPDDEAFFEKHVRPILVRRCYECHSASSARLRGGLLLDSREAILAGGDSGPAADAGGVAESLLVKAIRYDSEEIQMPPAGKLPPREIELLTEWVRRGLPFPAAVPARGTKKGIDIEAGRRHWAFQPLQRVESPPIPPGEYSAWAQRSIDRYVLAAQLQKGLRPSPAAGRRTLIRRLKFDLLGLPPEPEEITAFEADSHPAAYERLVERYLAAPAYGQRWGRHWLDLTRYCDVPESWREGKGMPWLYRDWVVQSFNADLPYNEFVRRQFAADLLPDARPEDNAALGFLGLSPTYWKELKLDHLVIQQVVAEEWEERIDAIGSTFLGLTLACARCHDHKYDPVTTQDYYALAGVLASVRLEDKSLLPPADAEVARQVRDKIAGLQQQIDKLSAVKPAPPDGAQQIADLRQQIAELRRTTPQLAAPVACGLADASLHVLPDGENRTRLEYRPGEALELAVHIRGNPANRGPVVPRRFLAVLARDPDQRFRQGSGRLELAEALLSDAGPLAARVFVNRIWRHHFGRGLVVAPSNFGVQGDRPSHPELLEYLAARFVAGGWSVKWLHREIVLSATYQQASLSSRETATSSAAIAAARIDPDNVWLARMPLRRLEVEAWRDAMLAATGDLDERLGGEPQELLDARNVRRTLYGTVKRRELSDLLRLYDFPDPVAHSSVREPTTTPLQQLFVLNSPYFRDRSAALARRLEAERCDDDAARVSWAYELLFGRPPAKEEVAAAEQYLAGIRAEGVPAAEAREQYYQILLASNELVFVD